MRRIHPPVAANTAFSIAEDRISQHSIRYIRTFEKDGEVSARLFGDTETRRFTIRCEEPGKNDSFDHLVVEVDEETGEHTFYTDGPESDDQWTLEVDLDTKEVTQAPPGEVTVSEPSSGTVQLRNPGGRVVDEWMP